MYNGTAKKQIQSKSNTHRFHLGCGDGGHVRVALGPRGVQALLVPLEGRIPGLILFFGRGDRSVAVSVIVAAV